jgi:RNA polymerase sigma-70 factor (ECF subfamily)
MVDDARNELVKLIPRLRRFTMALTGTRADGDDLAQDALEKALRRLDQFQRGTRLDSWLFRIAQNAWIDQMRSRQSRARVMIEDPEADAPGLDGRSAIAATLTLRTALGVLAKLPEEQRAVVALVQIEGYSYREAAEILGVPEGTVNSRLVRARTVLDAAVFGDEDNGS